MTMTEIECRLIEIENAMLDDDDMSKYTVLVERMLQDYPSYSP